MKRTLPKFLTIKEASEVTGISTRTLYTWIHSNGSIPVVKIRGRVFLKEADFLRWLEVNSKNIL